MASPTAQARLILSPRFSVEAAPPPANLQPTQLPFVAEVKARLRGGEYGLESSRCPCGEAAGVVISDVDRYGLPLTFVVCSACGTIRIDPYLDALSLEDFYTNFFQQMYARASDVPSYFQRQSAYGEKLLALTKDWLKPGSRVCEIGCGAGGALDVFQKNGYQVTGFEYSPELVAAGKERGVRNIYQGSLGDNEAAPEADLIYLHHVFEHVNNPVELLRQCGNRLAAGGRIVVIVPDVSRIDRSRSLLGDLLIFLHIAHKYNFSVEGLRRLASRAGFNMRTLRPDPNIQTHWSHMPELWVEFVPAAAGDTQLSATEVGTHGEKMLRYLRRTERLFSFGLCRGQLDARTLALRTSLRINLNRVRGITPRKIMRRLRLDISRRV